MVISIFFGGLVILIIIGLVVMDNKNSKDKKVMIKSIYFYLVSFITLGIIVGSLIFLLNLGFKQWVFPESDPLAYRLGPPPSLYLEADKPVATEIVSNTLSCDDQCILTSVQQSTIASWESDYDSWLKRRDNNTDRAMDFVSALSFFIVALPIFIIHFRLAQKNFGKESPIDKTAIRPIYFYAASLAALLMIVISSGLLINIGLKAWIIPEAEDTYSKELRGTIDVPISLSETAAVQSLVDCGSSCGLAQTTVDNANNWLADYQAWQDTSLNGLQRDAAAALPYLIFGIPLFWYHWSVARRESKEKQNQQQV